MRVACVRLALLVLVAISFVPIERSTVLAPGPPTAGLSWAGPDAQAGDPLASQAGLSGEPAFGSERWVLTVPEAEGVVSTPSAPRQISPRARPAPRSPPTA